MPLKNAAVPHQVPPVKNASNKVLQETQARDLARSAEKILQGMRWMPLSGRLAKQWQKKRLSAPSGGHEGQQRGALKKKTQEILRKLAEEHLKGKRHRKRETQSRKRKRWEGGRDGKEEEDAA